MRPSLWWLVLGGLAVAGAACGDPPVDQLVIEVIDGTGGRLQIPEELDAFEVRVATVYGGLDGGTQLVRFRRTYPLAPTPLAGAEDAVPPEAVTLPQTLAIVPALDGSGTVRVDVYGLKNGRVMQRLFRTSSFGVGLVRLPPFALTPLCFGVMCPDGESCEADGVCRPGEGRPDGGGVDAGPCGTTQVQCGDRCIPFDDFNCGACGRPCPTGERCISNVCACAAGTARCGETCVDVLTDATNCGSCGMACPTGDACSSGTCGCVLGGGMICGGICRMTATDPANCGGCGIMCALPRAPMVGCADGMCTVLSCDPGFGDCNLLGSDGCETLLNDAANCGACGNACALAHARDECPAGVCRIQSCNAGWDDCDGSDPNGCETSLSTPSDCGTCGRRCSFPNASPRCTGGMCEIAACNAGWGDCDGAAPNGCELNLMADEGNCGMCGRTCMEFERCVGGRCECTGSDAGGMCLPSCDQLLAARGAPSGGNTCCGGGCTTGVIGGPGETYDCMFCCAAPPGVDACP